VGMARAGAGHLEQDLAGTGGGPIDVLEYGEGLETLEHDCLHGCAPRCFAGGRTGRVTSVTSIPRLSRGAGCPGTPAGRTPGRGPARRLGARRGSARVPAQAEASLAAAFSEASSAVGRLPAAFSRCART